MIFKGDELMKVRVYRINEKNLFKDVTTLSKTNFNKYRVIVMEDDKGNINTKLLKNGLVLPKDKQNSYESKYIVETALMSYRGDEDERC